MSKAKKYVKCLDVGYIIYNPVFDLETEKMIIEYHTLWREAFASWFYPPDEHAHTQYCFSVCETNGELWEKTKSFLDKITAYNQIERNNTMVWFQYHFHDEEKLKS